MFKLRSFLGLTFVLFFVTGIFASEQQNKGEEKFCTCVKTTQKRNLYELDLSLLNSKFERVYFLNQLFKTHELVIMDSDPESATFSIGSSVKYPQEHVQLIVSGLKNEAQKKASTWNKSQIDSWMKECDKYYSNKKQ